MKIFFSGTSYTRDAIELPENVLKSPDVMMSFWDLYRNNPGAMRRWVRHKRARFYERKHGKQPPEPDKTLPGDDRG
jgi:hypothetical protein